MVFTVLDLTRIERVATNLGNAFDACPPGTDPETKQALLSAVDELRSMLPDPGFSPLQAFVLDRLAENHTLNEMGVVS